MASAEIDQLARRRDLHQGPRPVGIPLPSRRQVRQHDRLLPLADAQHRGSEAVSRQGAERPEALGMPHVINTDKAPTYAAALAELKKEGKCPEDTIHRKAKYL